MDTKLIDYQKHYLTFFPFDGIIIAQAHTFVNRIMEIISRKLGTRMLNCLYIAAQTLPRIEDIERYPSSLASTLVQSEYLLSDTN